MKSLTTFLSGLLLTLLLCQPTLAQQETLSTHTILLNHRQAEEVMSLLRPFLHPKGIMTGEGSRILVKTSAQNFRDLQQFVAEIDVARRLLRVSVTVDQEQVRRENAMQQPADQAPLLAMNSKHVGTGRRDKSALTQQVQVAEGKWATIKTGESVPVGQRMRNPDGTVTESVAYKSVNSGFQVLPRINGEQLTLFIRPQFDSRHPQGGARINTRSAETTVSGKLGKWILIGGAAQAEINQPGSRVYSTGKRMDLHHQLFVKVDVIQ